MVISILRFHWLLHRPALHTPALWQPGFAGAQQGFAAAWLRRFSAGRELREPRPGSRSREPAARRAAAAISGAISVLATPWPALSGFCVRSVPKRSGPDTFILDERRESWQELLSRPGLRFSAPQLWPRLQKTTSVSVVYLSVVTPVGGRRKKWHLLATPGGKVSLGDEESCCRPCGPRCPQRLAFPSPRLPIGRSMKWRSDGQER